MTSRNSLSETLLNANFKYPGLYELYGYYGLNGLEKYLECQPITDRLMEKILDDIERTRSCIGRDIEGDA